MMAKQMQLWAGTKEGLEEALIAEGIAPEAISAGMVIAHISVARGAVSKWCGIEEPPGDFILSAPIEGDGTATWTEYESGFWAPETDVYVLRFETDA